MAFETVDAKLLDKMFIRSAQPSEKLKTYCVTELGAAPVPVPIQVVSGTEPLRCFWNVAAHQKANGGELVFGWAIFEWPYLFWEGQHHAVWRDTTGQLIDISPPPITGMTTTLFVEAPDTAFEIEGDFGNPEDTERFFLRDWSALRLYSDYGVWIRDRQKLVPDSKAGSDTRLLNLKAIERSHKETILIQLANTLDAADICFCGSGLPFGNCCRTSFQA